MCAFPAPTAPARATTATVPCPACASEAPATAFGSLAPFVAELIQDESTHDVALHSCQECGLRFFDRRYEADEVALLYGRYRRPDYYQARHHWEPWYRSTQNSAMDPGSNTVKERVSFVTGMLKAANLPQPLGCLVDFGGDRGQLMPDHGAERRVVIDVSDQPPLEGILRLSSWEDLDRPADLVLASHVLEHVSEPLTMLQEFHKHMSAESHLYIEVPLDAPRTRPWHAQTGYERWLRLLGRSRWAFIAADFTTGVARQYGRRIPLLGVVKQSEHINYFDETSICRLLRRAGFTVMVVRSDEGARAGSFRLGRMGVVAKRTRDGVA
jgi:hypothetical protein